MYSGKATADPWYLGGTPRKQDPSPEDSSELEPVREQD
jgi:hypothetical protein